MASKRNKKIDQDVYYESKNDRPIYETNDRATYGANDRSNEGFYYNSNIRKKNYQTGKKDEIKKIGDTYPKNVRRQYEECDAYSRPRSGTYYPNSEWNDTRETYYQDNYYDQSYNDTRSYRVYTSERPLNKYKAPKSYDRFQLGDDKLKPKEQQSSYKKTDSTEHQSSYRKPKSTEHQSSYKKPESNEIQISHRKPESNEHQNLYRKSELTEHQSSYRKSESTEHQTFYKKAESTEHQSSYRKLESTEYQSSYRKTEAILNEERTQKKSADIELKRNYENIPRSRHNSHNKDFNDSRLFNPYKNDNDEAVKTNAKSGLPTDTRERPNNGKNDSHIHGGLIHLPENLELNSTTANNQPALAATISQSTESKWIENKPTVIVRPTFTQNVTSSSMSFPPGSLITGIPSIPGYIPVIPPYIPPGTINMYRSQPPPVTTGPLLQAAMRYPPQMIPSPDEAALFQGSNITSKFPIVAQSVTTIKNLEAQLDCFIRSSCDITSADWWQSVNHIRSELKNLYRLVITKDLDYCNQVGIEQNLWKSVYYSIMELIRTYISNPDSVPMQHSSKEELTKIKANVIGYGAQILNNGEEYFISLYTELSKSHNVDLEAIFSSRRPPPETSSRTRKLVYLSAQKLLLFLGDLTRYSEIINSTCDYSKARIWYMKAQLLVPKNGRPYNQLAVISIYANRHLDALYYYTRTLAASNPFPTASQSLSFLFEEARRKGDEIARRNQESLKRKRKKENATTDNRKKGSIEIWINPEDGTKEKKVTDDDDTDILAIFDNTDESKLKSESQIKEDFLSMPLIELSKIFTLSFLNSHGKLFGKINMENFPEVCSTMLQELLGLISHQPCPLTSYRLCHMLIINMYVMDRVSQQTSMLNSYALRSLHQDHASRMTLDFFALLCQRAIEILNDWLDSDSKVVAGSLHLPADMSLLLGPICLWTDWMVTHPEYWNPLPSHRDPLLLPIIDDFSLIADLCTKVNRIVEKTLPGLCRPRYRVITDSKESEKSINNPKSFVLLEESLISGFLPMLDQIPKIYLLEDDKWTKEQCEDWIHLEKLSLFGDFLCGIRPPFLDYDVDSGIYVSTMIKEGSERQQDGVSKPVVEPEVADDLDGLDDDLDLKLQMEIEEITTTHSTLGDDKLSSWADLTEQAEEEEREHQRRIAALKIKRANIKFKEQRNRRFELWRKSLLDHEIAQRFVELEIRPLFLVLDTNCYIDYLTDIDLLIGHRRFIIVVPLIVVNELENLARTNQMRDDVDINQRAKQALKYLEDRFERCDQNVKAITSKGTFMETIAFRTETVDLVEGETNDDVILNCCQVLCKDKASEFMPREKDKPITLHREVVLLTGDRNLRLKALSRHIPVKPLKSFIDWADIKRKCR